MTTMNETHGETLACSIIERLVKEFTSHHEHLEIKTLKLGRTTELQIRAHRADTGRIVGPEGKHIKAIERIAAFIGQKSGQRIVVNLLEPIVGEKERYARFMPRQDWGKERLLRLLQDTCTAVFTSECDVGCEDLEGDTSLMLVNVHGGEVPKVVEIVTASLQDLWNTVGRANGRLLHVEVVAPGISSRTAPLALK